MILARAAVQRHSEKYGGLRNVASTCHGTAMSKHDHKSAEGM